MTDSYQAIYDGVRSRISGADAYSAIKDAVSEKFDISYAVAGLKADFEIVAYELKRPSVLFKPRIFPDGNQWCALYGENLQDGVSAFGDTPERAAINFDIAWLNERCGKQEAPDGQ